jgi:hypothetical protein
MAINCPFGVNPLDQSQETKVPKLSFLSYTHQDFESMKSRLVKFILERFPRDFTDFVESSLAIMEMEIFAFIADTLSFKIDQIANEIYIDTVTEVENIFRIAKAVGFTPLSPLPATAFCSATITAVQPVDMVIPGGVLTTISINNQRIPYEIYFADSNNNPAFDEDIVIPAGSQTNTSLIAVTRPSKSCCKASVVSSDLSVIMRGKPIIMSRPLTSIVNGLSMYIAEPIFIFTSSAVRSPIARPYLRRICSAID